IAIVPDSECSTPILIVPCVWAATGPVTPATTAAASTACRILFVIPLSLSMCFRRGLRPAGWAQQDQGQAIRCPSAGFLGATVATCPNFRRQFGVPIVTAGLLQIRHDPSGSRGGKTPQAYPETRSNSGEHDDRQRRRPRRQSRILSRLHDPRRPSQPWMRCGGTVNLVPATGLR